MIQRNETALKSRYVIYWRHDEKSVWREYGSESSEHNARGAAEQARLVATRIPVEIQIRKVTTIEEVLDV